MSCSFKGSAKFKSIVKDTTTLAYSFDFNWQIDGIKKLVFEEELSSPEFSPIPGQKWCATVGHINLGFFLGFKITKSNFVFSELRTCFHASFMNSNDFEKFKVSKKGLFASVGIREIVALVFQVGPQKEMFYDLMECLKVHVLIEIFEIDKGAEVKSYDLSLTPSQQSVIKLAEDYKKMFETTDFTDITFGLEGKYLKAHKSVLSARSLTFKRMFKHESRDTIEIEDLSFSAMYNLLLFVYSGYQQHYDYDSATELYYASDKYDILDLREICSNILLKELDGKNFCELISLADRHQDTKFKGKLLNWAKDQFTQIFALDTWEQFARKEAILAGEIVAFVSRIDKK